ncbi:MAG TPA: hypothetical protein VE992_01885 [Solirubrobacteraceae bacterium]|nr:hypothetical protein [Solirubrobacteraceae bacterium]
MPTDPHAAPRALRAFLLAVLLAAAVTGCGGGGGSSSASSSSPAATTTASTSSTASTPAQGQLGFEGMPLETGPDLAPASTTGTAVVDGIQCGLTEQLAYHIHAHLQVYVNGAARALPGGIGIPGSTVEQTSVGPVAQGGQCIYWLHTHAPDGVIHIESPTQRIYTLGQFFDEWRQPLGPNQVAGAKGKVTALVDGQRWSGDPRQIKLTPHAVIQLDVGSPAPAFRNVSWAGTQL